MSRTAEEVYARYIQELPLAERLRLLEITARNLATEIARPERSLLELEGLGAEIWQGIDAQTYVDEIRKEWDERP
jgi:hypothetical protein